VHLNRLVELELLGGQARAAFHRDQNERMLSMSVGVKHGDENRGGGSPGLKDGSVEK
jgi:hypothetical protein